MIKLNSSYAYPFRTRFSTPLVLAACALIAATTLLATQAEAAPGAKVEVCHIPPGNPANFHTIKVSDNALAAHLAHGDIAGPCNDVCAVLCDDGNACTIDDTGDCENSGCPTTPETVDCNDSNVCTADSCDAVTGCEYESISGTCSVDDTDPCTEPNGLCAAGACESIPVPGCCNTTLDCQAVDEDLCTTEHCIDNACQTVGTVDCSIDACNISVCTPATGDCTEPVPVVCDEIECQTSDCNTTTGCFWTPIEGCCLGPEECDDENNCTTDTCLGVDGCTNDPCAAGDECNVLVDCDPDTCAPTTEPPDCEDGDLCTAESCVDGLGCVSAPVECPEGEECNSQSGVCEPTVLPCFSTLNAPPGSTIAQCVLDCDTNAQCPLGICDLKFANTALVNACLNGDTDSCLIIDQFGRDNGCQNICPLPEPEGPYLLLCGGSACARYDAGIADLANPMVRNFLDEYTYTHPVYGDTRGFNFAQAIGADGYFWAATTGNRFDNYTEVWVYDPEFNELVSCDAFGAATGGSCEDSALGCIGSVCGALVSFGQWHVQSDAAATHVADGIYASGNIGFQSSPPEERSALVRLSPAGFTRILSNADLFAGCSGPGLTTHNLNDLAPAPLDPTDPNKEEIYARARYSAGNYNEYWIVKVDVQSGVCSEVAVLNTEAGSNAVPYLPAHAIEGGVCAPCGLQRIRVADDGTIFFLIRPLDQSQTEDGIWRLADTDGDGDYAEETIVKIIDWEPVTNEIWDFAIGPHDGNLYLLAGGPPPAVDRVTIYEPNIALGDPSLGTVFILSGAQTKMEFFPLD